MKRRGIVLTMHVAHAVLDSADLSKHATAALVLTRCRRTHCSAVLEQSLLSASMHPVDTNSTLLASLFNLSLITINARHVTLTVCCSDAPSRTHYHCHDHYHNQMIMSTLLLEPLPAAP
jgi:hypothetical protein